MKLHKIVLENLNSLYGRHSIDLSRDLRDAPLFLIMGQTGAGKSTILDAICLALFGETPRLYKARGHASVDSRIVMSQGTGECSASVEFSKIVADGTRRFYRATWTCRRARGKADGRFQTVERSLEALDEERQPREVLVSSSKKSDYDPIFLDILEGMTASDFKRSILLAQGEFAAFIGADPEARATILERLTNTEIYRTLGKRAAQRMREAKELYQRLKDEADAISLLGAEAMEALQRRHDDAERRRAHWGGRLEAARKEEGWFLRRVEHRRKADAAQESVEQAREALEGRGGDAMLLEEDRRCRVAEPALREIERQEGERVVLEQQLWGLEDVERGTLAGLDQATQEEGSARRGRDEASALLEEMRPRLRHARELRQSLRQARDEQRMARLGHQEATDREAQARAALRHAEEGLAQAESEKGRHERLFAQVQQFVSLGAEISALKERHSTLREFDERLKGVRQRWSDEESALRRVQSQTREARAQVEALDRELEPLIEARDEAARLLEEVLEGASDAQSKRGALEAEELVLARRLAALERALRAAADGERLRGSLGANRAELVRLEEELGLRRLDREALRQEGERGRAGLAGRQEHLADLTLAVSLSEERASLKPGKPCALCGSESHPYAHSGDLQAKAAELRARHDALAQEVARLGAELRRGEERHAQLGAEAARLEQSLVERRNRAREEEARLRELDDQRVSALLEAGLPEGTAWEGLQEAQRTAQAARERVVAQRKRLEEREAAWRKREKEHQDNSAKSVQLHGLLDSLRGQAEIRQKNAEKLHEEIAAVKERRREVAQGLHDDLRRHSLEVRVLDGEPDLTGALEEAVEQVARTADRKHALSVAAQEVERASRAQEGAKLAWMAAHQKLEERADALKVRDAKVQELELDVARDRFAGDPDEAEQSFLASLAEATRRLEAAQARAGKLREDLARVAAQREERKRRRAELSLSLEQQTRALEAQLGQLGLLGREALAQALLPEAERLRLEQELKELGRALESAKGAAQAAQRDMDEHDQLRPEGLLLTANVEELREKRLEAERAHEEAFRDGVAARTLLQEQERLVLEQEALRGELEAAKREFELWKELHDLIGVKDGEKFRLFAQILNLQELIDKANQRISWLEPRYALVVARDEDGEPQLDFAVRDAHYAGQERPLTTLSGGETFIISLAMALALADCRAIRMPIETLLLDEGLGTLDQETLDVVIHALERLHSLGTQIGVISHIESLKERLQARIVVEKQGGGRSAFRFEFGQTLG
jgi:exonuclease SbcC